MSLADEGDFAENGGPSASSEGGVVQTVARAGGQVATAVRRLTLQSVRLLDNVSDDPFTVAAVDLEDLGEVEPMPPVEEETISDLERRIDADVDLHTGGGLNKFKAFAARYKDWTHRMKRFCPAVPETVTSKIDRVFWIDVLRIIACFVVPLVHAVNYTGTYGKPSPRYVGYYYCGYDATDPVSTGNRVYNTDHFTTFEKELEKYVERKYMTGFMTFFFASGAAMFLSMRRVRNFWPTFFKRNIYLLMIVALGSFLCVVPVNVIYYGARGTEPWKVDPTQHLGFIFTLIGFTIAATPAAWGVIKQSFAGWLIQIVVIGLLTIFYIVLPLTSDFPYEISIMWGISMVNLACMLITSYIKPLRDLRFPLTVALSLSAWAVPESIQDIWGLRQRGVANLLVTLGLIVSYYLIPFVLGFCVVGFPCKDSPNRTWKKMHLAIGLYIVTSPFFDPFTGEGWMEAWSIRTFDGRLQRIFYCMACWWVVILLYNIAKGMNNCPYPRFLGLLNKYTLFLFIFHPLFNAIISCNIFVYTTGIPMLAETLILYAFELVGCFAIFLLLFVALPLVVKKAKGKAKEMIKGSKKRRNKGKKSASPELESTSVLEHDDGAPAVVEVAGDVPLTEPITHKNADMA